MNLRTIARFTVVLFSILCICCVIVWFVSPCLQMGWDVVFSHYDHQVAVLPYDIECQVSTDSSMTQSLPIVLPKGFMLYAPCRHDFSRMSLDENAVYKIYLKLDAKTIKALYKDTDASYHEEIRGIRRHGELVEKRNVEQK